jgi:hypothetical protein
MSERKDHELLHQVLARFPKSRGTVRKLFNEDEQFRELCGDYADCMTVLDGLRQGRGTENERFEQYCELRVNIERELVSRVSEAARERAES